MLWQGIMRMSDRRPSSPTLAETRKRCPSIKCRWESTASAGCCDGSLKSQMIPPSTSATSCFCPPSINTSVPTWHLTPGGRWKPVRCARWETTWCRSTTGRSMSSTWRKTTQLGLSSGMIIDNRYCLQTIVFKIKLALKCTWRTLTHWCHHVWQNDTQ